MGVMCDSQQLGHYNSLLANSCEARLVPVQKNNSPKEKNRLIAAQKRKKVDSVKEDQAQSGGQTADSHG